MNRFIYGSPLKASIAVGLAVFAVMAVWSMTAQSKAAKTAGFRDVVVAAQDINAGQTLTDEMLDTERRPAEYIPAGACSKKSALIGVKTDLPLFKGEPVMSGRVTEETVSMVPAGQRAVALSLDETSPGVSIVQPGSMVDVAVTLGRDVTGEPETKTIVTRRRVIGVERPERSGVSVISVLVTPPEAERLAFAQANGRLALFLCPADDDLAGATAGVTASRL